MTRTDDPAIETIRTAILALLILTGVMLAALLTRTPPHPPLEVGPFALAPFLGASLAIGVAAHRLANARGIAGRMLVLLFAVTALVSFGPQKLVDPAFDRIWPAVLTAQGAIAAILIALIATVRRRSDVSADRPGDPQSRMATSRSS